MLTPRIGLYGEFLGAGNPEGESPLGVCAFGGNWNDVGEGVDGPVAYGDCLFGCPVKGELLLALPGWLK